ncbi:hypothetical protein AB0I30_22730 [Nocardia tengchongensis]|uniref:hypothetical protein n=1 Tax=Nocardia tengchongensis TaxID=2055889 RepID=UPI0033C2839B
MTTEEEALELGRTTPEVVEIAMQKELCDEARLDQAFARSTRRHAMLEDWIDSVNEPPGVGRGRDCRLHGIDLHLGWSWR